MNEKLIEEIRQKADIVDIVSEYIPLTQKGKNYVAVCPFHDDHNPSLVVSREKQIFNCFTCHTGGNVFSFVMKYDNVYFLEAVQYVGSKVGISFNFTKSKNNSDIKYKDAYEIMNLSTKFFCNNLNTKSGLEAKKYLLSRGINEDIIKDFKIGLALTDKSSLYNFLTKHEYDENSLEKVGLINKMGINVYDTFINRIMIPISNTSGQVVGFTGRIYDDSDQAKYINTKETDIFKKGEILFNFDNAKKYIRDAGKVYLVEGNMDAIKMYSSGFRNVIAIMGTALTKYQINELKQLHKPVVLMFDNDNAGLLATVKNGDLLNDSNVETEVIRLNKYKDPDEYIENMGVTKFQDILKKTTRFIDFKIDYLTNENDLSSSSGLIKYVKDIASAIKNEDNITKQIITNKIIKDNDLPEDIFKNIIESNVAKKENNIINTTTKDDKYVDLSKKILYYTLNDKKYIKLFDDEIGYFDTKAERDGYNKIKYYYKNNSGSNIADIISYFEQANDKYIIDLININQDFELDYNRFIEYLKIMNKYNLDIDIKKLKQKIKEEKNMDKKIILMDKLAELKKGFVDYERN